jgi:hypothetical protein
MSAAIILGAALSFATAAYAQQAADATPPAAATAPPASSNATAPSATPSATSTPAAAAPTASNTAAPKTPAAPSADLLKKAHIAGYYTRVRKGETFFCKKEVPLGTRFASENCMNQEQFAMSLENEQAQRDQMRSITCGGGSSCGGGK